MWAFQAAPTIQQPYLPLHFNNGPITRISSHVHHPTTATLRTATATTTNNKNPLIQSLCKKGNLKEAIQVLSHEPNPTQQTYELLILSCSRKNSLADGEKVHRKLVNDGFDEDPFLATKLINMYSDLDSIDHARQVPNEWRFAITVGGTLTLAHDMDM
ncbi:hypothetical protein RJ639_003513 [Escallonia herrerae]|uniref:Pentatricopeptide repeat-containing protein n=1 Tax=Escallonia herrerae TaxID=1293975 RepID=A0AA89AVP5_9ASTE|nr:hypothetical protein RJ639_003513 [Escallonia herrerae]